MRTPVDLLITSAVLKEMAPSRISDSMLDSVLESHPQVKNVCAKVSIQLSERIDGIVARLDISKRSFLEAAMIEACNKADSIIESEGLDDYEERRYFAMTGDTSPAEERA